MIKTLDPQIKSLILDMDGVLWRDNYPIGCLSDIFANIKSLGLQTIFATNNSTINADMYIKKLSSFGVNVQPCQIVTSAMATAYLLKQRFPQGGAVYIIGETGLHSTLLENDFIFDEDNVLAVVVGLDREVTYKKLSIATRLIRKGIPFYGTNPDRSFPTPNGLIPGAGAIIAAIEAATDIRPIIVGKPNINMINFAIDQLKTSPIQTLVVGDRLDTDILGGQNAGCRTALVLSGVSTLQEVEKWYPKPDLVAENLSSLINF